MVVCRHLCVKVVYVTLGEGLNVFHSQVADVVVHKQYGSLHLMTTPQNLSQGGSMHSSGVLLAG